MGSGKQGLRGRAHSKRRREQISRSSCERGWAIDATFFSVISAKARALNCGQHPSRKEACSVWQ